MNLRSLIAPFMGSDIFLSYRWSDNAKKYALSLRDALDKRGLDCFVDETSLSKGENIPHSIRRAIRSSKMVVLLATADAAESKWIPQEIQLANELDRKIVPINFQTTSENEVRGNRMNTMHGLLSFGDPWDS